MLQPNSDPALTHRGVMPDSQSHIISPTQEVILRAPVSGLLVPLDQVPDAVFSQNLAGRGIAIDPTSESIVSPVDGTITQLHSAHHAIGITTAQGLELLIHVGLDTVQLKGKGFNPHVCLYQKVKQGDTLLEFNSDQIAQQAKSLLTVLLITNSDATTQIEILGNSLIEARQPLIKVSNTKSMHVAPTHPHPKQPARLAPVQSEPIKIRAATGLHARPAAILASLAKKFKSEIKLFKGSQSAPLKSLVGVMSLEIAHGDEVYISALGSDADAAIQAISNELREGLAEESAKEFAKESRAEQIVKNLPTRKSSSETTLTGVTASAGLTAGCIFQLQSVVIEVSERGDTLAIENQKLNQALFEAKNQIIAMVKDFQRAQDPGKASIFLAHQELLEDPLLLEIARNELNIGKSASFAWQKAYTSMAQRLKSLKNELLAARANDLQDIGRRVGILLSGKEIKNFGQQDYPKNSILIAEDLTPSDVASLNRGQVAGFCTTTGGATSHVAILARSLDIPALASIDPAALDLENGTPVILNATQGELKLRPSSEEMTRFESARFKSDQKKKEDLRHTLEPATTLDHKRIEVVANLKASTEAASARSLGAEGVGLLRTEFLFMNRADAPSEDEQFDSYRTIVQTFGATHPVIIRTLDVGGDKPLAYLPLPKEDNPFLGERGLRVSLHRPELFRAQLRAILRASVYGNVKIMFPMVSTLTELRQAKDLLEEERKQLQINSIQIGIMVEVPSVALLADHFAREVDFFSIGSNDLTQYTLAIDRGHPQLAAQLDGLDPSLLHLIDRAVRAAHTYGKWVGVCGGIASDPQAIPILLGLGVDELSVSVPSIPAIKAQIRHLNHAQCSLLAQRALQVGTAKEVRALIPLETRGENVTK